jgi:hypothetical protein
VLLDIGDVRPVDRHSRAIVPYQAVEQTGIVMAKLLVDSVEVIIQREGLSSDELDDGGH